eukprot:1673409-Pleurochrysis_carterae.AAC.1
MAAPSLGSAWRLICALGSGWRQWQHAGAPACCSHWPRQLKWHAAPQQSVWMFESASRQIMHAVRFASSRASRLSASPCISSASVLRCTTSLSSSSHARLTSVASKSQNGASEPMVRHSHTART